MTGRSTLKILATFGQPRRRDRVRVVEETVRGEQMIRVQWKEGEQRKTQSFPNTRKGLAEAKAYAAGTSDRLAARVTSVEFSSISVRQLFERYINANVDSWRPRTLELVKQRWEKFELFIGRSTPAHMVTREHFDDFKRVMVSNKHSVNQVKHSISNAIWVFRFGVDRDLIPPTKVVSYRAQFGRDIKKKKIEMAEYSPEERARIMSQLDPRSDTQWRPWSLTVLFSFCGPRQNAALHLEWSDVELDPIQFDESGKALFGGKVRWNPEYDKTASARVQPLPHEVAEALWVAYGWYLATRRKQQHFGAPYTGTFVFFGARKKTRESGRPFTFQAYDRALHEAEKRAGVPHIKYRAAHAFRRGIAKDIYEITGSEHKAAEWIGDKSIRVVKDSYLKEREESQRALAALAGQKMQPHATKNENATAEGGEVEG